MRAAHPLQFKARSTPAVTRIPNIAVMVFLTFLVWGIDPFTRSIRIAGDDTNFLYAAWLRSGQPVLQQLMARYPIDGPTRSLAFWPFVLSHTHTPAPTVCLQIFMDLFGY